MVFDAPRATGGIEERLEAARAALASAAPVWLGVTLLGATLTSSLTPKPNPNLILTLNLKVARLLEHEVVRDKAHVLARQAATSPSPSP